jgi:hypothetical protein
LLLVVRKTGPLLQRVRSAQEERAWQDRLVKSEDWPGRRGLPLSLCEPGSSRRQFALGECRVRSRRKCFAK